MSKVNLYGKITRVEELEDGNVLIEGIAATENEVGGIIIPADVMRAALPSYMEFPAVREMHQAWAAGKTVAAEVGKDGCTRIAAKIVDDGAKAKVREGVYTAFSIGADIISRSAGNKKKVAELDLYEISVVDSPKDRNVEKFQILNLKTGEDMAAKKKAEKQETVIETAPAASSEAVTRAAEPAAAPEKPADKATGAPAAAITPAPEGAPVVQHHREELKRMNGAEIWDCKMALEALTTIQCLLSLEMSETHPEAASQTADLQAALDHIKAFVASEIQETEEGAGNIELVKTGGDLERGKFSKEHRSKMAAHDAALNQCREALRHCHEAYRSMGWQEEDKDAEKKGDAKEEPKKTDKTEQVATPAIEPVERVAAPVADDRLTAIEKRLAVAEEAATKAGEALQRVMGERDTLASEFKTAEAELVRKGVVRVIAVEKQNDGAPVAPQTEEPKTARDAITRVYQSGPSYIAR